MKKLVYNFIVLLLVFSGVLKADITTGLVAHYEFEDNSSDSSQSGYDLTQTSTSSYDTGKIGKAAIFDGTYYFHNQDINPSNTVTYSFWMKSNLELNPTRADDILIMQTPNTPDNRTNSIGTASSNTHLYMWGGTSQAYLTDSPTNYTEQLFDDTWHHVAIVANSSNNSVEFYVDGSSVNATVGASINAALGTKLYIGTRSDIGASTQFGYIGLLDDVRIYNRELNSTDVTELYNYALPELTLKAHGGAVQFDGTTGNKINLGDISELNSASKLTIETWVNPQSFESDNYIFSKTVGTDDEKRINVALDTNGSVSIAVANGANQYTYSTNSLSLNSWYHIAFVYDGTGATVDDRYKIYINGSLETNTATSPSGAPTSSYDLSGQNAYLGVNPFDNSIANIIQDEVRIWNTARTQSDINSTMDQQLDGNETGLVAYYNFDERLGDIVKDITGNGYDGTIEGDVTRLNFLGNGLSFDGGEDYVLIDPSIDMNSSSFTINAWIKTDYVANISSQIPLTFNYNNVGAEQFYFYVTNTSGTNDSFSFRTVDSSYDTTTTSITLDITQEYGKWRFFTGVIDRTAGKQRFYLDGELKQELDLNTSLITNSYPRLTIGGSYIYNTNNISYDFNGSVADVSYWNKALTDTQIQHLMNSVPDTNDSNLIGYWPLNEGSGTTANDFSPNSNDGTITGATWVDTAPTIYGDKIYTDFGIGSWEKLVTENNTTTPSFSLDVNNTNINYFDSTTGIFNYSGYLNTDSISVSDTANSVSAVFDVSISSSGDDNNISFINTTDYIDTGDGDDVLIISSDMNLSNVTINNLETIQLENNVNLIIDAEALHNKTITLQGDGNVSLEAYSIGTDYNYDNITNDLNGSMILDLKESIDISDISFLRKIDTLKGSYDITAPSGTGDISHLDVTNYTGTITLTCASTGTFNGSEANEIANKCVNAHGITIKTNGGDDSISGKDWGDNAYPGSGNDYVDLKYGDDVIYIDSSEFDSSDTLIGGPGTDTLTISGGGTVVDSAFTNVSTIEKVYFDDNTSWDITLGAEADGAGITQIDVSAITSAYNLDFSAMTNNVTLTMGDTNSTIIAGTGTTTLVLTGVEASYSIANNDTGAYTISNNQFSTTVSGVEYLSFSDNTNVDITVYEAQIKLESHGGVLQLDGTNYVSLGSRSDIRTLGDYGAIELWAYKDDWSVGNANESLISNTQGSGYDIAYSADASTLNGQFHISGAYYSVSIDKTTIPSGWNHFALSYDGESVSIYLNGQEQNSTAASGSITDTTALTDTYIGASLDTPIDPARNFIGLVDEVRIWNVDRDASDINSTMNQQLDGNETGLLAYYNFDERVGDSVVDITGSGSDGTIEGDVSRLNFLGDTLSLDGNSTYISIPYSSSYSTDYDSNTTQFSFNTWFKTSTSVSYQTLFSQTQGNFGELTRVIYIDSSKLGIGLSNDFPNTIDGDNETSKSVNDGLWHFVSVVVDGVDIYIYLDGVLDSTHTNDAFTSANASTLGAYIGGDLSGNYFDGNLAQVSLWNKALSLNEIKNLMVSSLSGDENGLVGYWPLEEPTTIAYDESSYGNDGNIASGTWVDTAPTIYGNNIYTSQNILTVDSLLVDNNSSTPTYAYNGSVPASVKYFGDGYIVYKSNTIGTEILDINATDGSTDLNLQIDVTVYENSSYINGTINDDTITGTVADDIIIPSLGDDIIDGGDGNDTVVVSGYQSSYNLIDNGDGTYTLSGTDGTKLLTNIEYISFDDASGILVDDIVGYSVVNVNLGSFGTWSQAQNTSNYTNNSFIDNSSYITMNISKISGAQSILSLYRATDNNDIMKEISMDVDFISIDASSFLVFKAIDTNGYKHQILINSQQALASIFNSADEVNTKSIYDLDSSNPFDGERIMLNMWAQNGTTYFNITNSDGNQIGRTIELYDVGVEGFIGYEIVAILDSSSSLNNMRFNFYGITDNQTLENTYYKRFPTIESKITASEFDSATALDPNGSIWYQFESDTYSSNNEYFNLKVGQINPVGSIVNESEILINTKGIIKDENKEQYSVSVSNNIITLDGDDGVEEVKYIGTLSSSDLNNLINTIGMDTSFSFSQGMGYEIYIKRQSTSCKVHNTDSYRDDYTGTDDIIANYSYNSNNTFQNFITHNRYNNLKVLAFSDIVTGELVEVNLVDNMLSQTSAGTSSIVSGVTCKKEDGSSVVLDIIDLEPSIAGYEYNDIAYKDGVKYNVEYQKTDDAYSVVFFNKDAISELLSHFALNETPVKEKTLVDVYNYISFPSNITLCTSELQSILSDCDQFHSLESVFGSVDAVFKYTGFWSYWKKNITNSTNIYDMDILSSIDNKEGFIVKTSTVQTLKIPYNLFETTEDDVIELYQNGWFLTGSIMDNTTTKIEDMVESQGKTLKYILHLNNNNWNVHAPYDDDRVDQSLPRMDSVKQEESFWIYVE